MPAHKQPHGIPVMEALVFQQWPLAMTPCSSIVSTSMRCRSENRKASPEHH